MASPPDVEGAGSGSCLTVSVLPLFLATSKTYWRGRRPRRCSVPAVYCSATTYTLAEIARLLD